MTFLSSSSTLIFSSISVLPCWDGVDDDEWGQSVRWPLFGQVHKLRMVDDGECGPVGMLATVWPTA
jgi:hypothetical protein